MFCAGDRSGKTVDLAHYSPGSHFSVFAIQGVRCGALICHDYRYPELYREYKRRGVQLMFHSYHAGHMPPKRFQAMRDTVGDSLHTLNPGSTIPGITMPATMHAAAANNYMWISCPNTSAWESCWPSFFVRPDGVITGRLRLHTVGILVSEVNTDAQLYDSTVAWRDRAMCGIFHSDTLVRDTRSDERMRLWTRCRPHFVSEESGACGGVAWSSVRLGGAAGGAPWGEGLGRGGHAEFSRCPAFAGALRPRTSPPSRTRASPVPTSD